MKRYPLLAMAECLVRSRCMDGNTLPDGGSPPRHEVKNITASVPETSNFLITAAVKQSLITPKQTARFELAVTWYGESSTTFKFGNSIPFSQPKYSSAPPGLLLLPPGGGVERQNDQTWLPKKTSSNTLGGPMVMVSREITYGETVRGSWDIWGDPRYVSHINSGEYQFENQIDHDSTNCSIPWTLNVEIVTASEDE